jgi:crotonobetainyl-CoA:carnitine CoA-transferase CaiB-like acyl-CoA transferase
MSGLLDGMRVLDVSIWRPVPHATQMLADLGAEVLKVEPPGGDPMRGFPELFADVASHKRSIILDLQTGEGRERALELVEDAGVFCEGWRPGVAARLGLDYDAVRARNPHIVYCSLSGFGQTGPLVDRRGHDLNYQALAGAVAPRAGQQPQQPLVPIADLAGGVVAALCICAAWARRVQTGEGEYIDVSMTDVIASWVGPRAGTKMQGRDEVAHAATAVMSRSRSSPRIISGAQCATRSNFLRSETSGITSVSTGSRNATPRYAPHVRRCRATSQSNASPPRAPR